MTARAEVLFALAVLPHCVAGYALPGAARPAVASRAAAVTMKGRGTRGMPGKQRGQERPNENSSLKKKMQKRDFETKREWGEVCRIDELGAETGSTKAVEAGITPQGQKFIWNIVRGAPGPAEGAVFACDGACRTCQFPLTNSATEKRADGIYALTCGLCGTVYSLKDGAVLDFLPANNPVQWASKLANEKKGEQQMATLPTRVSKSGRVYVRLPDGTLRDALPPSE